MDNKQWAAHVRMLLGDLNEALSEALERDVSLNIKQIEDLRTGAPLLKLTLLSENL